MGGFGKITKKQMDSVNPQKRGKRSRKRSKKGLLGSKAGNTLKISKTINQHYPPNLRTTLLMNTVYTVSGTSGGGNNAQVNQLFKLNSILNCGPATQSTITSAWSSFSANFPGGINYLIGSIQTTNPNQATRAPYSNFLVVGSRISVKVCTLNSANATNFPIQMVILPTDINWSIGALSQTVENFKEQPYARSIIIPGNTDNKAISIKHKMSVKRIFGLTRNIATNDAEYLGDYNSDPDVTCYWLFGFDNMSTGSTAPWELHCQVSVEYDVIFCARNMFGGVAPI